MIPISAHRPVGRIPMTWSLSMALLLIYAWQSLLGDQVYSLIANGGLVPARVGSATSWSVVGPTAQLMSLVTHIFLHEGWVHVLSNIWCLLLFGGAVELAMGRIRYAAFFMVVGMFSGAGYAMAHSESVRALIGASGAISGVMGAYLYLQPRAKVSTLLLPLPIRVQVPAWVYIVLWLVLQAVLVVTTQNREANIAFWAHIIGFVSGFGWARIRFNGTAARERVERVRTEDVQPWVGGEVQ